MVLEAQLSAGVEGREEEEAVQSTSKAAPARLWQGHGGPGEAVWLDWRGRGNEAGEVGSPDCARPRHIRESPKCIK